MSLKFVTLDLTQRCNFNCHHCYSKQTRKSDEDLSTKQWIEVFRKFVPEKPTLKRVAFSGGEPFLREDLFDLCVKCTEILQPPSIQTNGSLVTNEKLEKLRPFISDLQISLDYTYPFFQDTFRGFKGAHKDAAFSISYARDLGIPVTIAMVGAKFNIGFIDDMLEYAREVRAQLKILRFIPFMKSQEPLALDRGQNFMLHKFIVDNGLMVSSPLVNVLGRPSRCSAGTTRMSIDARGNAYPCAFVPRRLGNILTDTMDFLKHKAKMLKIEYYEKVAKQECAGCPYLELCAGGCLGAQVACGHRDFGCWLEV